MGAGESVGVVGNSGSGKTTLISVLLGLRAPDAGTALYDGRPLPALDRAGLLRFRREVQLIPQDARGSLDPRAGALRQVAEPLRRLTAAGGVSRGAARDEAARLLERVGLE
ncbi:ATP-binding cassette domain-containing protein, partial [Rothia sp. AR01]